MLLLAILLIPSVAFGQDVDPSPLLDPSALPALLPGWLERLLSYAFVIGTMLVTLANLGNGILTRLKAAGRVPPVWIELVVGLLLDAGTDLVALRDRIAGRK